MKANWTRGERTPGCSRMNARTFDSSELQLAEGCRTGIYGKGRRAMMVVTIVDMTFIQNIICWPVTAYLSNISSWVEFVAPSMARFINR